MFVTRLNLWLTIISNDNYELHVWPFIEALTFESITARVPIFSLTFFSKTIRWVTAGFLGWFLAQFKHAVVWRPHFYLQQSIASSPSAFLSLPSPRQVHSGQLFLHFSFIVPFHPPYLSRSVLTSSCGLFLLLNWSCFGLAVL